ncbi:MAG: restriction endonuclease subunit S [Gammaproteobacteria bacterium]|uniref:restriction endonuclease subunit S n=1 Tax=Rhodoferax sp. TaxID=50421 RepID=UPI0017C51D1E|nr:restriction endonuclease subunit S [Rhodoferax sp.]MBU3897426.1 restriction endonuclease subunit S [Gammaproteobacteria bacterium]MBA3057114.1 restriction endonuclease subunit S [Rhodoferax sp.]MBU3999305.1 restriction endonuclease subunit S [Gammaproteobacteria bacterium]MBU4018772.1 restriction endonuclease subunit S [Gammaproteobacteria bacterium]MBU4079727.1 restriction endonuclease subunit S [Gammaproteobacteria bacterium]
MSLPRYPNYKDSGVEWLGEVPGHWAVRKSRWLCEIKKRISGELGHDVLSITQQGIRVRDLESNNGQLSMDYSKYQFVKVGDFAMNHMDLLTGYVDIASVRGVTSPDYRVFSIRDPGVCFDKYLLYLFQMGYKNRIFYAYGQGSSQLGRWRLPTEQFQELAFPLPPATEQTQIAAFLDRETAKIDELVAEQRRLMELLKEKRQAVISHAVTLGLNPDAPLKPSGIEWLGDVPEHWEVGPLKRYWSVTDCKHVTAEFVDEGIPLASIREVQSRWVSLENAKCTTDHFYELLIEGGRCPLPGDLIFSRNATVGEVAQVSADHPRFAMGQDVVLLRKQSPEYSSDYLQHVIRSPIIILQLANMMIGSTFKRINVEEIRSFVVPSPPATEQAEISEFLERELGGFDTLTSEAQRAIDLLQERRTALISAAVTGQIDVRGAVSA